MKRALIPLLFGGNRWKTVQKPTANFDWIPFEIQKLGKQFRVSPSWDISAQVPRIGGTYYVAKTGNDTTGNGLSWATAWKTIAKAVSVINSIENCVVYIGEGMYGWGESVPYILGSTNRSFIGVGNVVIDDALPLTWSLTAGKTYTYEATYGGPASTIVDWDNIDSDGDPLRYVNVASIDAVESTPGSTYHTSAAPWITYCHPINNQAPSSQIRAAYGGSFQTNTANKSIYLENLTTINYSVASGYANAPIYAKNVRFLYSECGGAVQIYQECRYKGYFTSDGAQRDLVGGTDVKIIQIDCTGKNSGGSAYIGSNVSTNHGSGQTLIINGDYSNTYGPPIGLIGTGYYWLLGVTSHDNLATSSNYYSFQLQGTDVYLDTCTSYGSTKDIGATGTVHVRNFTGASSNDGTIVNY